MDNVKRQAWPDPYLLGLELVNGHISIAVEQWVLIWKQTHLRCHPHLMDLQSLSRKPRDRTLHVRAFIHCE